MKIGRGRSRRRLLLEQNNDWAVNGARSMTLKTMAPLIDDPIVTLPAVAP